MTVTKRKKSAISQILHYVTTKKKQSPVSSLPQPAITPRTKIFTNPDSYDSDSKTSTTNNSPDLLPGQLPGQFPTNLPNPKDVVQQAASRLERQSIAYMDKRTNPESRVLYSYLMRERHVKDKAKEMFDQLKAILDGKTDGAKSVNGIINTVNMKQSRSYTSSGTLTIPMVIKTAKTKNADNLNIEYLNQCILYSWQPYFPVFVEPIFQLYHPSDPQQPTVQEMSIDTMNHIHQRVPFEKLLIAPIDTLETKRMMVASVELARTITLYDWVISAPDPKLIHETFRMLFFLLREWSGLLVHGDLHANNILLEPLSANQFVCYEFQRSSGTVLFYLPFRLYIIDVARVCFKPDMYPGQLFVALQSLHSTISGTVTVPLADIRFFLTFIRHMPDFVMSELVTHLLNPNLSEYEILDNMYQFYTNSYVLPPPPAERIVVTFRCPPPPVGPIRERLIDKSLITLMERYHGSSTWQANYDQHLEMLYNTLHRWIREYIDNHPDINSISMLGLTKTRKEVNASWLLPRFHLRTRLNTINSAYMTNLSHYGGPRNPWGYGFISYFFKADTP